jgi:hypothetical protein
VRVQVLATLATVGDLSYAFDIISDYIPLMHARIKRDPFAVLLLRATFLKLASVLELPLVRINQAASADLASVAEYYSSQLVAFVRRVLEVVPANMFLILNDIRHMFLILNDIRWCPQICFSSSTTSLRCRRAACVCFLLASSAPTSQPTRRWRSATTLLAVHTRFRV